MRRFPFHLGVSMVAALAMVTGCSSTATTPSDGTAGSGSPQGNGVALDSGREGASVPSAALDSGVPSSSGRRSGAAGGSGASGSASGSGTSSGASGLADAGDGLQDGSRSPDSGRGQPGPDASAAPTDGGPAASDAAAFPDQFQQHNLDVINTYRVAGGLRPLVLDATLSAFALAGSQELTQDHIPHQHFMSAGKALFTPANGFKTSAGENQGDPNGWTVTSQDATMNELTQIDEIMKAMYDEGPAGDAGMHGHYLNMMSTTFTRVGVGLIEVSGQLYLTNDFSN